MAFLKDLTITTVLLLLMNQLKKVNEGLVSFQIFYFHSSKSRINQFLKKIKGR